MHLPRWFAARQPTKKTKNVETEEEELQTGLPANFEERKQCRPLSSLL